MAKRKGKSQRRIKNWQQLVHAGLGEEEASSHRQKVVPPAVKIPSWRQVEEDKDLQALPHREGMVVGLFPGGAIVRCEGEELLCGLAGTFRAPEGSSALAVGDAVTVAITKAHHDASGADKVRSDGAILQRQTRRTALSRPQPRSGKRRDLYETEMFEKVIVANMDVLLIVASTRQPPLRPGLIDRFMIIAQRGELSPVLVINKIDLERPAKDELDAYRALGLPVVCCSAQTGEGIDTLRETLGGRACVLAGASGVGKSSLVNAVVPGAQAATGEVRARDERGRHTTASARVYDLAGGGLLVDTPGVRELGITMDLPELAWYFPEFTPFAAQCKFNDCTHTHEPSCGVARAVEEGNLPPPRYDRYLRIFETLERR